jgi:hypothetical protein
MYYDAGVLQVDAFGEQIGGEQEGHRQMCRRWRPSVGARGEVFEKIGPGDGPAGDAGSGAGDHSNPGDIREGAIQCLHRSRVLRERHDRGVRMRIPDLAKRLCPQSVGIA